MIRRSPRSTRTCTLFPNTTLCRFLRNGSYRAPLPPDQILIGVALADRLGVGPGDRLRYGEADFTIADIITDEPDRVGEGFTLGPVAIVSMAAMRRTGLIQPGSLFESKYRIRLAPGTDAHALRERLERRYATAETDRASVREGRGAYV